MVKRGLIHLAAWLCSRVKFIRCIWGGLSGGLLPVLPVFRPERSERVRSGADNRCYGKSASHSELVRKNRDQKPRFFSCSSASVRRRISSCN